MAGTQVSGLNPAHPFTLCLEAPWGPWEWATVAGQRQGLQFPFQSSGSAFAVLTVMCASKILLYHRVLQLKKG